MLPSFHWRPGRKTTAAIVAAGLLAVPAVVALPDLHAQTANAPAPANQNAPTMIEPRSAEVPTFSLAPLIERVGPAVVSVRVTKNVQTSDLEEGLDSLPGPFRDFFRRFYGDENQQGSPGPHMRPMPRQAQGAGSGFLIDAQGHVVTNVHVVKDADEVSVATADGKSYEAKVVGLDPRTDLAVLKIEDEGKLPFVSLARGDDARVGDYVVAIGNPFGLSQTATSGIVSARHRVIGAGPYDDFLQIDAPINPGNSGGPVFNLKGEVVGVSAAIFSPSGGNIGIGFAIPASLARDVVADLLAHGEVRRGWLGVQIQSVTPEIAENLGVDSRGALVVSVSPDSPAAKAGLATGDVITAVDGQAVGEPRELSRLVAGKEIGRQMSLTVIRDGSERKLSAEVARLQETAAATPTGPAARQRGTLGLTLAPIDPQTRDSLDLAEGTTGVLVAQVQPGSPAAEAGLQRGDVIKRVGRTGVGQPAEVVTRVDDARKSKQKSVLLLVQRDGMDRFVALPLGTAAG